MNRGFTLIESIVYIALLGLIMTGTVATAYQLVSSSGSLATKNMAGEEGNFVLHKLNWTLSSASILDTSVAHQLTVTRHDGVTVVIKLNGNEVDMKEGGGSFLPITTGNVTVSSFTFVDIPVVGTSPEGITATLVLNGLMFSATKYLRK
jgi:prepilin-type N-terminal cleavage/methylation domain-containing protein